MSIKNQIKTGSRAIATILGLTKRGFYIPFRHAASVPAPPPVYAELEAIFEKARPAFQATLDLIEAEPALADAVSGPLSNHWCGGYFGPLDTAATFALARDRQPQQIIEVGSGSSTHTLAAAVGPEVIRCIDPVPRHEISELGVTWEKAVLDATHVALFAELSAGDIAFFDSSHVLFEGTDVDIIENRILPVLKKGVLVHIHDIFLPDPYPADWAQRAYTEQSGLGGWIGGGAYRMLFSSHYAATRMRSQGEHALGRLPAFGAVGGGSLWLERL